MIERLEAALRDRYRIERELGAGGMATVYLAHDIKHERKVALKVLRPELAAVVGAERFLAEIKTTAALQHPHILPLFDSGESDSFLFYVMPYVEGESLRDRLERERQLPVDEAVRIARDVADALDYAHRQGVVHRDIKPANVLLHEGRPVVADFGIALAVSQAGGGRITETGLSLGTPHYMSPEQASGERDVDPRSDVYALGCVLYEMLSGEPPYGGPTAQAVLARILTEQPRSVTDIRRSVPRHVAAVVARSLEKLPADRFASAAAFKGALDDEDFRHHASDGPVAVGPARGRATGRRVSGAGVGLAGLGLVGLAVAFAVGRSTAPQPEHPVTRFRVTLPDDVSPTSVCCGPVEALSPDGEWLVFVGVGDGREGLYRRRLGALEAERIPGTDDASVPFFSPDGRWVGFHSDGRLRKVPVAGGPPVPIAEVDRVDGASWGDDGVIVFAVDEDSLHTVPAGGGTPKAVAHADEGHYIHPWMLPGGGVALARVDGGADQDARIVAVDLETGSADTLGFGTRVAYASGHLVISGADGTLLAQPFDPEERRVTGPAVAILDDVALAGPSIGEFALAANGSMVYWSGESGSGEAVVIRDASGIEEIPLPNPGNIEDPSFSPDGRRIALRVATVDGGGQIWIWDRDQQTQELLTVEGREHFSPVWSPDGSRLAFGRRTAGGSTAIGIFVQPTDGSAPASPILATESDAVPNQFTPDGSALLITAKSGEGGNSDIGLLELDGGTVRWLVDTAAEDFHPQISPDGRWLAYTSDRSGRTEVYVQPLDGAGGRVQVSTGGGQAPRWAPDESVLYFVTTERRPVMAASYATEGGFRVLAREETFPGPHDLNGVEAEALTITWDVSPDGEESVFITRGEVNASNDAYIWILNWPGIVRRMQTAGGS